MFGIVVRSRIMSKVHTYRTEVYPGVGMTHRSVPFAVAKDEQETITSRYSVRQFGIYARTGGEDGRKFS